VSIADKLESNDCSAAGLIQNPRGCLTAYRTASGSYKKFDDISSAVLWYGLFLLSTVPMAVSSCYKQKVLKGVNLDVMYAVWWSGNFQVVWGILLFWVNWIPLPEQKVQLPSETFQLIADTWSCLQGNVPHPGDEACAADGAPGIKWFIIYLFFNLSFNICYLWLTKRMSAVWAQIATALCLCLTNIFSQFPFLVGDAAQLMTLSQWLGTIMAAVALWIYNLQPEIQAEENSKDKSSVMANDLETSVCQAEPFVATGMPPFDPNYAPGDTLA